MPFVTAPTSNLKVPVLFRATVRNLNEANPNHNQSLTFIEYNSLTVDPANMVVKPISINLPNQDSWLLEFVPTTNIYRATYKKAGRMGMLIAPDTGAAPIVKLIDPADGSTLLSIQAYDTSFTGGVRVATADFNDDGIADIVTAPGYGGSEVKVFDGIDGTLLYSFSPFGGSDGLYVAAGDMNNDGIADLVISRDQGSQSEIRVYDGSYDGVDLSFTQSQTINPFDSSFTGGVRVAIGDINGDGFNDIVASTAEGGVLLYEEEYAYVHVYSGLDSSLLTYLVSPLTETTMTGGYHVAVGDLDGDGRAELLIGCGTGAGPYVTIVSMDSSGNPYLYGFFRAFSPYFAGGVRVAVGDYDNDGDVDILVGQGSGDDSKYGLYDGLSLTLVSPFWIFDENFTGGVFVA